MELFSGPPGTDLTDGRYDDATHPLFSTLGPWRSPDRRKEGVLRGVPEKLQEENPFSCVCFRSKEAQFFPEMRFNDPASNLFLFLGVYPWRLFPHTSGEMSGETVLSNQI